MGEREGAGADREHAGAARGGGAQRRQRRLRRRLEDAGVAGDDDRVGPAQRLEAGLRGDPEAAGRAHRGAVERAGRELVERLAAGRGAQREGLRRRREVEGDEAVEAEGDDAVHGRNLSNIGIPASGDERRRRARIRAMKIAILIFDKLTALDAIGPYEVLRSVPGWEVQLRRRREGRGARPTAARLGLSADRALDEVDASPTSSSSPAAPATGRCCEDEEVLAWLREVDRDDQVDDLGLHRLAGARRRRPARGQAGDRPLALPGAAARSTAPTRSAAASSRTARSITAAGVSAGIDMALHLVGREAGPEVAQAVQLGDRVRPRSPPSTPAPRRRRRPEIVELVTAVSAGDPTLSLGD